jgi:hypothetical protein
MGTMAALTGMPASYRPSARAQRIDTGDSMQGRTRSCCMNACRPSRTLRVNLEPQTNWRYMRRASGGRCVLCPRALKRGETTNAAT